MPRGKRDIGRVSTGRRSRTPLGTPLPALSVDPIEGFSQHWFNDVGDRVQRAYDNDYDFVTRTEGEGENAREIKVSKRVGTNADGSAQVAYLMKKRQDWYDEDQKIKGKPNDEVDRAIRSGKPVGGGADAEKFYDAGSSLKSETR